MPIPLLYPIQVMSTCPAPSSFWPWWTSTRDVAHQSPPPPPSGRGDRRWLKGCTSIAIYPGRLPVTVRTFHPGDVHPGTLPSSFDPSNILYPIVLQCSEKNEKALIKQNKTKRQRKSLNLNGLQAALKIIYRSAWIGRCWCSIDS